MSARGNAKSGAKNYGSKDRKAEGKALRAGAKRLTWQEQWDAGIAAGKRLQAGISERGAKK